MKVSKKGSKELQFDSCSKYKYNHDSFIYLYSLHSTSVCQQCDFNETLYMLIGALISGNKYEHESSGYLYIVCFELSPTYFQLTKIAAPTFAISKAPIYKFITEISPLNWCKSSYRIYFCVLNKCIHRLARYSTHECLIMTRPRVESRFFAILPNKQNTKEKNIYVFIIRMA